MASKYCIVCSSRLNMFSTFVGCIDGPICKSCLKHMKCVLTPENVESMHNQTLNEIRESHGLDPININENVIKANAIADGQIPAESSSEAIVPVEEVDPELAAIEAFTPTDSITKQIKFDDKSKQVIISKFRHIVYSPKVYTLHSYNDIVDFEYEEDGHVVTASGMGKALIGGALFGGLGFIGGGLMGRGKVKGDKCTKMGVKIIYLDNGKHETVYIPFIETSTKKNSFSYRVNKELAEKLILKLMDITKIVEDEKALAAPTNDLAETIKGYKQLLDDEAITQEEFDMLKRKAMGLDV